MGARLARVLMVFVGLLVPATASAQFGLRGGVNLSRFVGAEEDTDTEARLNMGASLTLLRLGPISIGPEVYYAQKGAGNVATESADPRQRLADFRLDYLEVPVLARLTFGLPGAGALRPWIQAGPAFAWQLGCEVSFEGVASGGFQDCDDPLLRGDAKEAFRSADRGVVAGVGIDLVVGSIGVVSLDGRVVRGLARISEGVEIDEGARNQTVTLMLGYSFGVPGGF